MLDPWIIEEIRKREEDNGRWQPLPLYEEPPLEILPLPVPDKKQNDRGVVEFPLGQEGENKDASYRWG